MQRLSFGFKSKQTPDLMFVHRAPDLMTVTHISDFSDSNTSWRQTRFPVMSSAGSQLCCLSCVQVQRSHEHKVLRLCLLFEVSRAVTSREKNLKFLLQKLQTASSEEVPSSSSRTVMITGRRRRHSLFPLLEKSKIKHREVVFFFL